MKAGGFNALLVCRLLGVKQVERDVSAYQAAVVETELYDSGNEQRFWSVRSDTYMVKSTGVAVREPRSELIREFVETVIREMSKSNVL